MKFCRGAFLLLALAVCASAQTSAAPPFYTGGDISLLARAEQLGAVYKDGGQPRDTLSIFKSRGCTLMRLRLWVAPDPKNPVAVNDLPYTIALGRRIKNAGFHLLLDFHFSDFWADPGHQTKPAAWRDLPFDALTKQIEDYSRETIARMRAGGAMPDMVQVGNETTNGMLWPDGKVEEPGGWKKYGALVKAAIKGVRAGAGNAPKPQIMIHIANGGQPGLPIWFFDNLKAKEQGINFDLIGLSYYPDGKDTLTDLENNLKRVAKTYGKPIVIAETGFPHAGTPRSNQPVLIQYGLTPDGQKRYLTDLVALVKRTPGGLGRGVIYWEPEWIGINGLPQFYGQNPLFDDNFNALPALDALAP